MEMVLLAMVGNMETLFGSSPYTNLSPRTLDTDT